MKLIIGICLLAAPLVAVFILAVASIGWVGAAITFSSAMIIIGCIAGGISLIAADWDLD